MKNILGIIFILTTINSFGQQFELNDFTIDSLPVGDKVYKANISNQDWFIKKVNDSIKICIDNFKPAKLDSTKIIASPKNKTDVAKLLREARITKKVHDGLMIGINNGEFGGALWFLSSNGKELYQVKSFINVQDIFNFNGNLYVTHGLAHLGLNYGSISKLKKEKKWKISKSFTLRAKPIIVLHEKKSLLILTTKGLVNFDKNEKLTTILQAPFAWGMLYPSSVIIENKDIFIAMRKGILKISNFKSNPNYKWYIKKEKYPK